MLDARAPLAALVAEGWDEHAQQPAAVAEALSGRAATLPADADGAGAISLAEHVWLAHLHDPAGLSAFLANLPDAATAGGRTRPAVQRARWALAALDGSEAPEIDDGARWRALQNVLSVRIAKGHAQAAARILKEQVPLALAHPDAQARRGLAATCNNLAVDLRLGVRGDAARDALMIEAAQASQALWRSAGTWVHAERADYQLARCHAALGHGLPAVAHARACLAAIEAHAGEPEAYTFERFYAHEALAWAHRTAGDAAAATAERARMEALLREVPDASARSWCEASARDYDAAA